MRKMNYFGYIVQEDGVILGKRGTPLTPHDNGKGYLIVNLQIGKNRLCKAVHRLLAECFIPNPLGLSDVDHIDGNRANNKLDNLRWVTHGDNIKHSFDLENRSATGVENANSIFDEETVHAVCKLLEQGLMPAEIRDLGFDYSLARTIRSRKNWRSISKDYKW